MAIASTSTDAGLGDLAWAKGDGLLPAIVQHVRTGEVLMLGYMNEAALQATRSQGYVTFYSRSKQRLWMKGESSGHRLRLVAVHADCDRDTLLVRADPEGPTCHLGTSSCFEGVEPGGVRTLVELDALIAQRAMLRPAGSYTASLFDAGLPRMAQKVGEEGVELALAGVGQDRDAVLAEAADLFFHSLVLLRAHGLGLDELTRALQARRA